MQKRFTKPQARFVQDPAQSRRMGLEMSQHIDSSGKVPCGRPSGEMWMPARCKMACTLHLSLQNAVASPDHPPIRKSRMSDRTQLELVAVSKRYGATVAVDRIDLKIAGGSYCCLLGP